MPPSPSPRLTAGQVAQRLGVSRETVHRLDGELAPERVGARGDRIYDPARVERIAKERAK